MKIIFIFFLIFIPTIIFTQPLYFQRIYSNSPNNLYFNNIIKSGSSDFIVTGYTQFDSPFRYNAYIAKINKYGLPIWNKVITSPNNSMFVYSMFVKDDKFILSGTSDSLYTLAIDSSGNQIWLKKYPLIGISIYSLNGGANNMIIGCGTNGNNQAVIVQFDSKGNYLNQKVFNAGYSSGFYKFYFFENYYYFLGHSEDSLGQYATPYLVKMDTDLDTLLTKKINFPMNSLIANNFFIKNNLITIFNTQQNFVTNKKRNFVINTNLNFEIIDTLSINVPGTTNYADLLEKVVQTSSNNYIVESIFNTINSDYLYKVLDSNFNVIKTKNLNTSISNDITLEGLFFSDDNSIFSIGSYRTNSDFAANHFGYINKMDTALNIYNGILNISSSVEKNENHFSIGPNPFNSEIRIDLGNNYKQISKIEVFNLLGQLITEKQQFEISNQDILINMGKFQSGIYFIKILQENGNNFSKKIILIK